MDGMFFPVFRFQFRSFVPFVNVPIGFLMSIMIEEPIRYIDDFVDAGADIITAHAEACSILTAQWRQSGKRGFWPVWH